MFLRDKLSTAIASLLEEQENLIVSICILQIVFTPWHWYYNLRHSCHSFAHRRFSVPPCTCEILLLHFLNETQLSLAHLIVRLLYRYRYKHSGVHAACSQTLLKPFVNLLAERSVQTQTIFFFCLVSCFIAYSYAAISRFKILYFVVMYLDIVPASLNLKCVNLSFSVHD